MALLTIFIGANIAACGGGDDENDEEKPNNKLSAAANKFIGYWHITGTGSAGYIKGVAFFPDGKCYGLANYPWNITESEIQPSSWSYNEQTGVLGTSITMEHPVGTVVSFQWKITLSDDKAWAGEMLGNGNACSAQLGSNAVYAEAALYAYTWVSEKDGTSFSYKGKRNQFNDSYYASDTLFQQITGKYIMTLNNPKSKDFYFTNQYGGKWVKSNE